MRMMIFSLLAWAGHPSPPGDYGRLDGRDPLATYDACQTILVI
jgi:hypothetical protein